MSWLGWWWRVQQSVISMLNSRISWINRDLNAHCAFGVFLKACLLQRLLSIISKLPWLSHAWLLHALCVRGAFCLWHMQLIACLLVIHLRLRIYALLPCGWQLTSSTFKGIVCRHLSKHELRPASPLNLSI